MLTDIHQVKEIYNMRLVKKKKHISKNSPLWLYLEDFMQVILKLCTLSTFHYFLFPVLYYSTYNAAFSVLATQLHCNIRLLVTDRYAIEQDVWRKYNRIGLSLRLASDMQMMLPAYICECICVCTCCINKTIPNFSKLLWQMLIGFQWSG